jgi:hypothetical protein
MASQTKQMLAVLFFVAGLSFGVTSEAALYDRGNGLIYDDVLNVTWFKDANYAKTSGYHPTGNMSWGQSMAWVEQLTYAGFSDWRLPSTKPVNGSIFNYRSSNDGSTDLAYNIRSPNSEMSYMFYVNLGNIGERDINGNLTGCIGSGFCLKNTDPFKNMIQANVRTWSSSTPPKPNDGKDQTFAFIFVAPGGFQSLYGKEHGAQAWAVRDGDVAAVPVPSALLLFTSGLFVIRVLAKRAHLKT